MRIGEVVSEDVMCGSLLSFLVLIARVDGIDPGCVPQARLQACCDRTDRSVWYDHKKESLRFQAVQIIEKSIARLQQQLLVLGVFGRTGHARLRRHDERRHFPWSQVS